MVSCDGVLAASDATGVGDLACDGAAVDLAGRGPIIPVASLFCLDEATSSVEGAGPHVVEESTQLGQAFGAGTVQPTRAVPPLGEKACLLEDGEVLADSRAGHVEGSCDLTRSELLLGDESQDGPPSGFSQRP